jgi:putative transcription factor
MDHQDWNNVVFNADKKERNTNNQKVKSNNSTIKTKIEKNLDSNDVSAPPKIGLELKLALQKARLSKNLTQKALALQVGVPIIDITNYENGKAIPNNQFIAKLERSLGCKLPRVKNK